MSVVCVCICSCFCVCVYICVFCIRMRVEVRGECWLSFSTARTLFFETGFLIKFSLSLPIGLCWLASQLQDSACPHAPLLGLQMYCMLSFCMDTVSEHRALLDWHPPYQLSYCSSLRTEITENNLIQLRLCRMVIQPPTNYLVYVCFTHQHNILNSWGEICTVEGDMTRHFGQKYWCRVSKTLSTSIFTRANLSHWSNYISKFINRSNFLLEKNDILRNVMK